MIDTRRLRLRRWRDSDVAPMAAINADPEVMRWVGDGTPRDEAQTRDRLAIMEREWDTEGFGLFAVELRDTGELTGFTGLTVAVPLPGVPPSVEIGWRLGRTFWGRGLATEAAAAVVRFAFTDRGLDRLISIIQVGNDASERVAAKLGMTLDRELEDPASGRSIRIHALTRV